MESKWLIQEKGDKIIDFGYYSINLTGYIKFLEERLKADRMFHQGEIGAMLNATKSRIKNPNSQSTDSVDNGIT